MPRRSCTVCECLFRLIYQQLKAKPRLSPWGPSEFAQKEERSRARARNTQFAPVYTLNMPASVSMRRAWSGGDWFTVT